MPATSSARALPNVRSKTVIVRLAAPRLHPATMQRMREATAHGVIRHAALPAVQPSPCRLRPAIASPPALVCRNVQRSAPASPKACNHPNRRLPHRIGSTHRSPQSVERFVSASSVVRHRIASSTGWSTSACARASQAACSIVPTAARSMFRPVRVHPMSAASTNRNARDFFPAPKTSKPPRKTEASPGHAATHPHPTR